MGLWRKKFYLLRNLFALAGVFACVAGIIGFKLILDKYQLTPHQFAVKLPNKAGIDSPVVAELLARKGDNGVSSVLPSTGSITWSWDENS